MDFKINIFQGCGSSNKYFSRTWIFTSIFLRTSILKKSFIKDHQEDVDFQKKNQIIKTCFFIFFLGSPGRGFLIVFFFSKDRQNVDLFSKDHQTLIFSIYFSNDYPF